jgi:pyruvate formate lyase activating enzyme
MAPAGRVFNVQRFSLHDGPGIRTTVFLKGCPLHCEWCHNPEGIAPEPEIVVVASRCIACGTCVAVCPEGLADVRGGFTGDRADCTVCGSCVDACPAEARQIAGREVTVRALLGELLRDRVFFDDSGGGVTFSGGEPLLQVRFLEAMLEACRAEGLSTAVDTSGLAPLKHLLRIAALTDLFLFDVKLVDEERHRRHTGVSNATILANLEALTRVHGNIWLRVPVVPGVNDDAENLAATAALAARLPSVRRVTLLPYHRLGTDKLRRLGRPEALEEIAPPSRGRMEELAAGFAAAGVHASIRG